VDGEPMVGNRVRAWQRAIAHVPQTIFLADTSLAENIALGIPRNDIDMPRVMLAARQAQIAEFIEARPEGYDACVGERGIRLSGGQRQRIGIARAIVRNNPILILDEPTAALDTESEQLVMEALERLMKGRTVITIAHRLSTIRNADKIVVLKGGVVAEEGSHDELLARNGVYAELYKVQFSSPPPASSAAAVANAAA